MTTGAPSYGSTDPVFNPLVYAKRVIISVLRSAFQQEAPVQFGDDYSAPVNINFRVILDANGNPTKDSRLVIADTYTDELFATDSRPHVVVSRGALQFSDLALNASRGFAAIPLLKKKTTDNHYLYGDTGRTMAGFQDLVQAPVIITCYSRRQIECETLAWLCAFFIRAFEQEIKDGAKLHKIESPIISAVQPADLDSQHDLFLCQITILVYQSLRWTKSTTVSPDVLSPNFANSSGYLFPVTTASPLCIKAHPSSLTNVSPDYLTDRWYGE